MLTKKLKLRGNSPAANVIGRISRLEICNFSADYSQLYTETFISLLQSRKWQKVFFFSKTPMFHNYTPLCARNFMATLTTLNRKMINTIVSKYTQFRQFSAQLRDLEKAPRKWSQVYARYVQLSHMRLGCETVWASLAKISWSFSRQQKWEKIMRNRYLKSVFSFGLLANTERDTIAQRKPFTKTGFWVLAAVTAQ